MAMSSLGLGFLFTAKDLASAKIRHLNSTMTRFTKESEAAALKYERNMKKIKSGMMMLGAGVVGLVGINRMTKEYGQFEHRLVSAGQVMNASAAEMMALKKAGIEAGIATQFSPTEAVMGLENLGAAGFKAKEAIATLNPVLGLASASLGQLGVGDAASVVVGVLNAFGESTDMAAKRVDQLVKITQVSNFQARDFSIALSQASAQAKAADQSFESMIATLGLLRNTNLDASSAATAYREATRRLAGDQVAQKKLAQLNVDTLDKQTGKIKDLAKIVFELQPNLEKLNAKERNLALTKMFGVRGMKTYNAIMSGYTKLVKEGKVQVGDYAAAHRMLMNELGKAEGTMGRTRDALLNTAEGQRILLKGSWETFKIIAGETFTPVLLPALKGTISTLNSLISVIQKIPAPIKGMMAQFVGFSAIAMTAVGSMRLLSGAMGIFSMSGKAGQWLSAQAAMGSAANNSTMKVNALAGSTGRLAKVNSTLSRGLAGLGKALPYIGIAAAGIAAVYNMIKADEKAIQEERQKRAQMNRRLSAEIAKGYAQIEMAANKTRDAAIDAAEALVKKAQAHQGLVRTNLLKLEQQVLKAVSTRRKKMEEMLAIESSLRNRSLTMTQRAEAVKRKMTLEGEIRNAEMIIQANKWAATRVRGLDAEKRISTARTAKQRLELTQKAIAGRVAQERYLSRVIASEEKKKTTAENAGLTMAAKAHAANIDKLKAKRNKERMAAAKLAGASGVKDPNIRRRMIMRIAKPELESVSSFGSEARRSQMTEALLTGNVPEGMSLRDLKELRGMAAGEAGDSAFHARAAGVYERQGFIQKLDELIVLQRRQSMQTMRGPGGERTLTVNLNLDGKTLKTQLVRVDRDDTTSEGGTAGAGNS